MTDAELAAELAEAAGRLLLELRGGPLSGQELGDAADEAANRLLLDRLARERPDDGILSEERKDTPERLAMSRVWIVDPLDGTREYREGRSDWAVHVAVAVDGLAAAGAVALPATGGVFRSDRPEALAPPADIPRVVVSRTRPPEQALAVAEALGADLVAMGSAGAKAMAVIRGDAEIYLHAGGQYEWDNCAPVAVALAYGLYCSRLDGSALTYNHGDPYVPDMLICRPEWAERVLATVASA